MSREDFQVITRRDAFEQLCDEIRQADVVGIDTEFVSENSYYPELCLIQVEVGGRLALIDPLELGDVSAFWRALVEEPVETIVHGGREELLFCLRATERRPHKLLDLQVAAGLVGMSYPIGYANLCKKVLGIDAGKGEQRTDWRRRPLTQRQLRYAADDVRYLRELRRHFHQKLTDLGRMPWLEAEMDAWQEAIESELRHERWRRVKGCNSLNAKQLAVLRAAWRWREQQARERDIRPKRVLRDDLLCAVARRASAEQQQIQRIRGFEQSGAGRHIPALQKVIREALELDPADWPRPNRPQERDDPKVDLLSQLMVLGMHHACQEADVAPSLVASHKQLRQLVRERLAGGRRGTAEDAELELLQGWRGEVVGETLEGLLDGRVTVRIADLHAENPLVFEG